MADSKRACPDCEVDAGQFNRRDFLKTASAAAVAAGSLPVFASAKDAAPASQPESVVKVLYESLSPEQKKLICYDWDHIDSERGLLRTRVAANWHINDLVINSDFFSNDQRAMIRDVFEGIVHFYRA